MPNLPYTCYQRVFENIQSFLLRRIVHHLHGSEIFVQRCKTLYLISGFKLIIYQLTLLQARSYFPHYVDVPTKKLRETPEDSRENARNLYLKKWTERNFAFWRKRNFLLNPGP
jgi:hypothetical protein